MPYHANIHTTLSEKRQKDSCHTYQRLENEDTPETCGISIQKPPIQEHKDTRRPRNEKHITYS